MYEWLLEFAKNHGIRGGSAFVAIAGYGRHGLMHEEHFFELASNVPVEVVFLMPESESDRFLDLIKSEKVDLIYSKTKIDYGSTK
jgi:PII-like signaling protein